MLREVSHKVKKIKIHNKRRKENQEAEKFSTPFVAT